MTTYAPNTYQLDAEYRNRKLAQAAQQQLISTDHSNSSEWVNPKRFASPLIIILTLAIMFLASAPSQAQERYTTFDSGSGEEGSSDMASMLYVADGLDAFVAGDNDEALRGFNDAISTQPDAAFGYIARSTFNLLQGNTEAALADALIAYELEPDSTTIQFTLGAVAYEMGDYEAASTYYEAYLATGTPSFLLDSLLGDSMATAQNQLDTMGR